MTDEFDMPKLMPLLFEKMTVPVLTDCVPADIATPPAPPPAAEAVTVEPFRPNDTPLLLLKTTFVRLPEVVPAETLKPILLIDSVLPLTETVMPLVPTRLEVAGADSCSEPLL